MKITNLGEVIPQLKPLLKQYLEEHGTTFKNTLFTCPNRAEHANGDAHPSCGFVPETDETVCHCFSCSNNFDLFDAYHFLEEKPIKGASFHIAVRDLCDKYGIAYQTAALSPQEQEEANVQDFLQKLVIQAHANLITKQPEQVMSYLRERKWDSLIEIFQFGYIPDTDQIKEKIKSIYSLVKKMRLQN